MCTRYWNQEMYAKTLSYVVYESNGWTWKSHQIQNPTWDEIQLSITRLDKFRYPFLHLWPTVDPSEHEMIDGREWFDVMGGNGDYWIAGTIGAYFQRRFVNPKGGDHEVELWTSDQGFADEERFVCYDLETALRITKYYAEHGDFDPDAEWE